EKVRTEEMGSLFWRRSGDGACRGSNASIFVTLDRCNGSCSRRRGCYRRSSRVWQGESRRTGGKKADETINDRHACNGTLEVEIFRTDSFKVRSWLALYIDLETWRLGRIERNAPLHPASPGREAQAAPALDQSQP